MDENPDIFIEVDRPVNIVDIGISKTWDMTKIPSVGIKVRGQSTISVYGLTDDIAKNPDDILISPPGTYKARS